ncbi:MAG: TonB-dependent receptor plug domain-containing protein [Gammaproteobacteria bacterium]
MTFKFTVLATAIFIAQQAQAQVDVNRPDFLEQPQPDPGIEEVVVAARYIPDEKRSTAAIANVLDASAFQAAGDSSVADGLKRVSGLNLQGDKFVYIRGLGERYSSTVLNGSTLPSPEPINRVVPLDLFPASIIDSVLVQKTFSAQYPAEFAGGTIQMRTKAVPSESFFEVSGSLGYSGNTTGKNGLVYSGGGDDWMGTDDGTRNIPPALKTAIAGDRELRPNNRFYTKGFEPAELEALGESLSNNYQTRAKKIQPDNSAAVNFGTAFEPGDSGDFTLGLLGNLSYSNTWDTLEVSRNSYTADASGKLNTNNIQTWRATEQSVDTSMFLTTGLSWRETHTLKATVLQIHKMDDLAGNLRGYFASEAVDIDQHRLEWIEQDLLSQQLDGEHIFDRLNGLTLNWHYNTSRAKREAPDMREYRYQLDTEDDVYKFSLRGDANTRMWSALEDQNEDAGFSVKAFLDTPFDTPTTLTAGIVTMTKERDSDIRRFGFTGSPRDRRILGNPSLDEILSADNIGPGNFELREATRPTDNYVANQDLDAWFVEADMELGSAFRLMAGFRGEESVQHVRTFDLFANEVVIESELKSDDIFPAVTGTWILDDWDMQLRASYSETISRPDFRELSPSPFTHPVTGYEIVGNPELTVAYIKNYDLRWEWYTSSRESVSLGFFYKEFAAPIEAVIKPGAAEQRSFINAQDATTRGIEFDVTRELGGLHDWLENFYAGANISLIESTVSIRPEDRGILTNAMRPLQGQADFIANLQLGYDDGFLQKGALVYHVTGDKIREVGIAGAPDVIDETYGELDLVYTRYWSERLEMNIKVKNLLNPWQETTQGGLDVNSFRDGTSGSIGLTYAF